MGANKGDNGEAKEDEIKGGKNEQSVIIENPRREEGEVDETKEERKDENIVNEAKEGYHHSLSKQEDKHGSKESELRDSTSDSRVQSLSTQLWQGWMGEEKESYSPMKETPSTQGITLEGLGMGGSTGIVNEETLKQQMEEKEEAWRNKYAMSVYEDLCKIAEGIY